jgi:hypothetical protein
MIAPIASVVDGDALLEVVWVSLVAGVGVSGAFGVAILGATRALDLSRDGRSAEALLFGAIGLAALAVVIAGIVLGIVAMTSKD